MSFHLENPKVHCSSKDFQSTRSTASRSCISIWKCGNPLLWASATARYMKGPLSFLSRLIYFVTSSEITWRRQLNCSPNDRLSRSTPCKLSRCLATARDQLCTDTVHVSVPNQVRYAQAVSCFARAAHRNCRTRRQLSHFRHRTSKAIRKTAEWPLSGLLPNNSRDTGEVQPPETSHSQDVNEVRRPPLDRARAAVAATARKLRDFSTTS